MDMELQNKLIDALYLARDTLRRCPLSPAGEAAIQAASDAIDEAEGGQQ